MRCWREGPLYLAQTRVRISSQVVPPDCRYLGDCTRSRLDLLELLRTFTCPLPRRSHTCYHLTKMVRMETPSLDFKSGEERISDGPVSRGVPDFIWSKGREKLQIWNFLYARSTFLSFFFGQTESGRRERSPSLEHVKPCIIRSEIGKHSYFSRMKILRYLRISAYIFYIFTYILKSRKNHPLLGVYLLWNL